MDVYRRYNYSYRKLTTVIISYLYLTLDNELAIYS